MAGYRPALFSRDPKRRARAVRRATPKTVVRRVSQGSPSIPSARPKSYNPAPKGANPVSAPRKTSVKQGRKIEARARKVNRKTVAKGRKRAKVKEARARAKTRAHWRNLPDNRWVGNDAKIKIKDRDTKLLGFNIEAELEGRGGLAKVGETLKKGLGSKVGETIVSRSDSLGLGLLGGEFKKAILKDAIDIPTQAPASVYALGASGVEAYKGRPQRGEKLWEEFKTGDPIALAAQGKFKQAGKAAKAHPLMTGLEVTGGGRVISRGAGGATRVAGESLRKAPTKQARKRGKRLRQIGSTKRAPRRLEGTRSVQKRTYSKGLAEKGVQVAVEKGQARYSRRLREQAKRTSDPERKIELRRRAAQNDPRTVRPAELRRRMDERESVAEARRRQNRAQAMEEVGKALPRKHADIVLLVAQVMARPSRPGLTKLLKDVDGQIRSGNLSKAQALTAKKLRNQVAAALESKKLDFAAITRSAEAYAKVVRPRQKELVARGIIAPEQARMAPLVPAAVREMGAKWNRKAERFEDRHGNEVSAAAIEAHLRESGIDPKDVPYVTQAPGQGGAKNFFMSWHEPKGVSSGRRTGEAARKGAFEVSHEVARENVARMQGLRDAANEYAGFIGEMGHRAGRKKNVKAFQNYKEGQSYRREHLQNSPVEWRLVPIRPEFGRAEQSQALLSQADAGDATPPALVREGVQQALKGKGDENGKWVLVPATAANRMGDHSRLLGSAGLKVWRKGGRQFSATVLTSQGFTWPLGNVLEGSVRLAIKRAGPVSLALGRKTIAEVRKIDPDKAAEIEANIGQGHGGSYEANAIHTVAKDFNDTKFASVAQVTGAFFRAPGPKQTAALWNRYTHFIFGTNGILEHQFKVALYGRYLIGEGYSPSKLALSEGVGALSKAAEQAAKGQRHTAEQVAAARFVRRAYGQYEAWSPEMRYAAAVFTPFIAWSINAVRFMTSVLPKDHPALTGLLVASEQATEEWRKEMGLGNAVDGAAPQWLQAAVPVGKGLMPIGRYTPFGFFADPLDQAGTLVLPQVQGLIMASKGLDWKGDPLNDKNRGDDVTGGERAAEMAKVAARAFVPFFGAQQKIKEKGVKDGLNPLRVYEHDTELAKGFEGYEDAQAKLAALRKTKHPKNGRWIDAENPTREYTRLLAQSKKANRRKWVRSKGKYGSDPGGGSGPKSSKEELQEFKKGSSSTTRDDYKEFLNKPKTSVQDEYKAFLKN